MEEFINSFKLRFKFLILRLVSVDILFSFVYTRLYFASLVGSYFTKAGVTMQLIYNKAVSERLLDVNKKFGGIELRLWYSHVTTFSQYVKDLLHNFLILGPRNVTRVVKALNNKELQVAEEYLQFLRNMLVSQVPEGFRLLVFDSETKVELETIKVLDKVLFSIYFEIEQRQIGVSRSPWLTLNPKVYL